MVKIKDYLLFLVLTLLLGSNYFLMEQQHMLLYLFLLVFIIFSFISLIVSHKSGAKIQGWGSIITYRDYTSIFINLTQLGIIFNLFFLFHLGNYDQIMVLIGFIIMLTGMGFNLLVRRELGRNWVPLSKTTEGQELVITGIYSKIRHPFYTSILILFLGITVMAWNLYAWFFYVLFVISVIIRFKKEEKELIAKFGAEYRIYMEEVPAIFPKSRLKDFFKLV